MAINPLLSSSFGAFLGGFVGAFLGSFVRYFVFSSSPPPIGFLPNILVHKYGYTREEAQDITRELMNLYGHAHTFQNFLKNPKYYDHDALQVLILIAKGRYWGGDTVYGVVELNVKSSDFKARGVRFFFNAFEHVHWTETKSHGKTTSSVSYSARRTFLSHRIDFVGAPRDERDKASTFIIPEGVYHYPFAITLPKITPPSFKLYAADITYRVTAYVDIPRAFDISHSINLNVGGSLMDHNVFAEPTGPVLIKNSASFMFKSGHMHLDSSIPQANYFVGDTVPILVNVKNETGKHVDAVKVELITKGMWTSSGGHHQYRTYSAGKLEYDVKIDEKTDREGIVLHFSIPPVIPTLTNLPVPDFLKHISLEHFIRVRLDIPWASDLEVNIPVKIMFADPRKSRLNATPYESIYPTFQGTPSNKKEKEEKEHEQGEGHFTNFSSLSSSNIPLYPILDSYQYPTNTTTADLTPGEYEIDDDEKAFLLS